MDTFETFRGDMRHKLISYYFPSIFHIWERKIFKSNGFFLQNLPRIYLCSTLRVLPIEFNSHKISFVRYVFEEIFGVFLNDENDPLMTK